MYSPLTRGCFPGNLREVVTDAVFPAHAGVFLAIGIHHSLGLGIPRSRGGVSLPCW